MWHSRCIELAELLNLGGYFLQVLLLGSERASEILYILCIHCAATNEAIRQAQVGSKRMRVRFSSLIKNSQEEAWNQKAKWVSKKQASLIDVQTDEHKNPENE